MAARAIAYSIARDVTGCNVERGASTSSADMDLQRSSGDERERVDGGSAPGRDVPGTAGAA